MHFIKNKFAIIAIALLASLSVTAQNAGVAAEQIVTSQKNQLATLLVVTTIVFAFVIWGLGQVLIAFSKQMMEKNKNNSNLLSVSLLIGLTLLSQISFAQGTAPVETVKVIPNYGGLTAMEFYLMATVIVVEIAAILFLTFSIRRIYTELLAKPQTEGVVAKQSNVREWWDRMDKKLFTKAVPVEKEADILLDHDYDGIHELDNALPPWWKYGFYITIAVAFFYIFYYHVSGAGKNPLQEYQAEMEKAKIEKEIFEAQNKDKIDEANVPFADAAGLEKAKGIFNTDCWACHGKLGEGGAGPNLTDDYWIHKGSLNDIYASIKLGYPDKGMQSWAVKYTPKEMSLLASYIKTLKGTNPPNGKAPQGDLYKEATSADSTAAPKADSVAVASTIK